ncbi:hypothetical protein MMC20_001765 [Loxospora ochrophaea]|nr:hypothetical protein [Loxospora ochrophaea]
MHSRYLLSLALVLLCTAVIADDQDTHPDSTTTTTLDDSHKTTETPITTHKDSTTDDDNNKLTTTLKTTSKSDSSPVITHPTATGPKKTPVPISLNSLQADLLNSEVATYVAAETGSLAGQLESDKAALAASSSIQIGGWNYLTDATFTTTIMPSALTYLPKAEQTLFMSQVGAQITLEEQAAKAEGLAAATSGNSSSGANRTASAGAAPRQTGAALLAGAVAAGVMGLAAGL